MRLASSIASFFWEAERGEDIVEGHAERMGWRKMREGVERDLKVVVDELG